MSNKLIDERLKSLIKSYIEDFIEKQNNPELKNVIVENSIPVIWFGDIDKYLKSKLRVITVALNPSVKEFYNSKTNTVENRFEIVDFQQGVTDDSINSLKETLCQYFKTNALKPYSLWFSWPEYALNCLGATYYDLPKHRINEADCYNTAVHIDVYSAIATDPTWSKLEYDIQNKLKNTDLFSELVKYLDPDIIMVSVSDIANIISLFPDCNFVFVGEKFEYRGKYKEKVYLRRYVSDNKNLLWMSPWKSSAFGQRHEFTQQSIKELMKGLR